MEVEKIATESWKISCQQKMQIQKISRPWKCYFWVKILKKFEGWNISYKLTFRNASVVGWSDWVIVRMNKRDFESAIPLSLFKATIVDAL